MMATASVILTATTLALGIYCRINFGKGLTRYRKCTISNLVYNVMTEVKCNTLT